MNGKTARISLSLLSHFCAALFSTLACALPSMGETLRIATFNTELSRKGPGLLLRDIERGEDAQILAVIAVIAQNQPDILALQGIDWDYDNLALKALERRLALAGAPYPHLFAKKPNSGVMTTLDLDGDSRLDGPGDSQGYGSYTGKGGLAVLSRLPFRRNEIADLTPLLWREIPGTTLPRHPDGSPFPSAQAQAVQRLSSTAHWALPVELPLGGTMTLLTFHATPPVFDGTEDRNGLRNADEIGLWQHYLSGHLPQVALRPNRPFVIAGDANLDPSRGDGNRRAIQQLLQDSRLHDPRPRSTRGALNTVAWEKAGDMRVDYVLPSRDLTVIAAGVVWPETTQSPAAIASRHRLVWIDVALP